MNKNQLRAADIAAGIHRATANAPNAERLVNSFPHWSDCPECGKEYRCPDCGGSRNEGTHGSCGSLTKPNHHFTAAGLKTFSCQSCSFGDHSRCTGETTLGTRSCACRDQSHEEG